jgi:hypothetical protein
LTQTLSWLCASILVVGCRYVVSFDGFSGGQSGPAAGDGGSGGGMGGLGGSNSVGGEGGSTGGTSGGTKPDDDGSPGDAPPDTPPTGVTLVYSAPQGASIRGITVFGPNLYWAEGGPGRGLFKMPKDGSTTDPTPLHNVDTYDVAVDANFIYWADADLYMYRIPISGGINTPPTRGFAHNAPLPRYIIVDDSGTIYVTTGTGDILSGNLTSSARPYSGQMGVAGIDFYTNVDAGTRKLIWGHASGIKEGPPGGLMMPMDVKDLYTGLVVPVQGVATDGERMYWISNNDSIRKGEQGRASAGPWCVTSQDLGPYADITVDEAWVYFTWPSKNQIYKCPK